MHVVMVKLNLGLHHISTLTRWWLLKTCKTGRQAIKGTYFRECACRITG